VAVYYRSEPCESVSTESHPGVGVAHLLLRVGVFEFLEQFWHGFCLVTVDYSQ
jgi:hypothetical protein